MMSNPKSGTDLKESGGSDEVSDSGVLQRVIREVGGGSSYPTLAKMNYANWTFLMKVKLWAHVL
jgi:hypothetical protein